MRRTLLLLLTLAAFTALALAENKPGETLDIVRGREGGNAVLFVTSAGESVLIDSGNIGSGAVRDAGRIADAARHAGRQQIDNLIFTVYHGITSAGSPMPRHSDPGVLRSWHTHPAGPRRRN